MVELDGSTRLSSISVTGGHVCLWLEDVSEINRLLAELKETGECLSENNDLLQAELELKERQVRADEKNRLYDKVTREVAPQLKTLEALLSSDSADASLSRKKLTEVCFLGTYIKRRCNLLILSEDNAILSAKELEYCMWESAEALSYCEIPCSFKRCFEGILAAEDIVLLYDLFEEIVELSLPSLTALFINLNAADGRVEMKIQITCTSENVTAAKLANLSKFINRGGRITETEEDGTLHIALYLPDGGMCL